MEIAGYKGERVHRTNTHRLAHCPHCGAMSNTIMDDDGNRYCGKCRESYEGYEVIDPKDFPPDQLEEQLKRYKK